LALLLVGVPMPPDSGVAAWALWPKILDLMVSKRLMVVSLSPKWPRE